MAKALGKHASTGPLRIRSGNGSAGNIQVVGQTWLQRGRSEFGAEIPVDPHQHLRGLDAASTGPLRIRSGNICRIAHCACGATRASTGPLRIRSGNLAIHASAGKQGWALQRGRSEFGAEMAPDGQRSTVRRKASTGPLRIRSGNMPSLRNPLASTPSLQRGRSEFGAEIRSTRWKRRWGGGGFNGAAPNSERKLHSPSADISPQALCFNGAAPNSERKCAFPPGWPASAKELQRGRSEFGAEMTFDLPGRGGRVTASTGPLRIRSGNKRCSTGAS